MSNNGLIAEYLLNGNANDTSGGGHHGTVHGATPSTDRFGKPNSAFHFDGVDDYIEVSPPPAINVDAFSVSVWVRYDPRDMEGWTNTILAQDNGNDEDQSRRVFQLSTFQSRIVWHRMVGARDPMAKRPVRSGRWFQVVGVCENGEHRLYLDGEHHDSVSHRFWTHPSQPLHIGRKGTNEHYFFFCGDIDDVRLYNRALGDGDVRLLFEEGGYRAPVDATNVNIGDPLSGRWGQHGITFLNLRYDGDAVTGVIMARDPGHMALVSRGTFDRSTGALRLEGTASHPDDASRVPYVIEGRLMDNEITVAATFAERSHVNSGNYILNKTDAYGGWWMNSALRWRMRKLFGRQRRRR